MTTPPGRALATRQPDPSVNITGELETLGQVWSVSEVLALSDLVPSRMYGHPAAVFQVIVTGQRLGLHWTEAIRVIYSPGPGQIGMLTQFLLSRLREKGHKYSAVYSEDGESCTFTLIRKDEPDNPYEATFSMQDAAAAKLTSKDNWVRYKRRMLRARAISDCLSFAAPELVLGFELEGDEFASPAVELHPQSPAPPGPTGPPESVPPDSGQAAASDQAAQAQQLRELSEQMAGVADLVEQGEVVDATITDEELSEVGGISESGGESAPEPAAEPEAQPEAVDEPGDEPVDAAGKAKTVVLAEWFTRLGYDPKQYRPRVLNACSVYVRRRIEGVRNLKAAEVMDLCKELDALWRRSETSELHPVSILADQISTWQDAWEREDPDGYAEYTGP